MMVPEGWEVKRFGELAKINMGQSPDSAFVNEQRDGIAFLQGNAEFGAVCPSAKYWVTEPKKVAEAGEVLISVRAPVGQINRANQAYCIGRGLASLKINKLDPEYGYFAFSLAKDQLNRLAQGSTFLAISKDDLNVISMLVPPKSEQKKIATILSTLDRTIEATQKLIDKEKMVKKGLMADLLTHGIDEQGRIRSSQTHTYVDSLLGMIPQGWEVKPLSDFFKLKSGDTKPIDTSSQGLYGVYGGNGITGYSNYYNNDATTLVIGRVGEYCGCVYKVDKCWITDNALLIDKKILSFDTNYMFFLLTFLNLNQYKSETGQPLLNQTIIGKVIVPYVPKQEQQRIATILSAQDRKIETEETNLAKLQNLKKGLMGDLLSGDVRVKG